MANKLAQAAVGAAVAAGVAVGILALLGSDSAPVVAAAVAGAVGAVFSSQAVRSR